MVEEAVSIVARTPAACVAESRVVNFGTASGEYCATYFGTGLVGLGTAGRSCYVTLAVVAATVASGANIAATVVASYWGNALANVIVVLNYCANTAAAVCRTVAGIALTNISAYGTAFAAVAASGWAN